MPFVSAAQRAVVMAKLKAKGFKLKPSQKVEGGKRYFRLRQESPSRFQKGSFRIKDVGEQGGVKIVVARPLGRETTRVQSILVDRRLLHDV